MKWMIGPRQIGKTTKLIEEVGKNAFDVVWISADMHISKYHMNAYFYLFKDDSVMRDEERVILHGNKKVYFRSVGEMLDDPRTKYLDNLPKVIEDADIIFDRMFRRVCVVTGSGPNIEWSDEALEKARVRDVEEFLRARQLVGEGDS